MNRAELRVCPLSLEAVRDPWATPCCATVCERAYLEEALRRSSVCPMCRTPIDGRAPGGVVECFVARFQRRGARQLTSTGRDSVREVVRAASLDSDAADAVRASLGVDTRPIRAYAGGAWVPLEGVTVRVAQQLIHACDADSLLVGSVPRRRFRFRRVPRAPPSSPTAPQAAVAARVPAFNARFTQADVDRLFTRKT